MSAELLPVDEVVERLLNLAIPLQDTEKVAIGDSVGRVLAEEIRSAVDVPPDDNSSMDGYVIDATDASFEPDGVYEVSDRIAAGYVGKPLKPGTIARIFTGAPVPDGANAVIMQEETEIIDADHVRLHRIPAVDENIRKAGQDIEKGTVLFSAGTRIRPQDSALMASVGTDRVEVFRRLRVAVMSTGDELVEPPGPAGPGQIFNSNHYALTGLIRNLGMTVVDLGLVRDTIEDTEAALSRGAAEADCIVSSGGVSVGEEDHVKNVLERLGELELWRIAIKPGKPLAHGRIDGTPFFGLPGNPVSTFVTFTMIARPYLLKSQGCNECMLSPIPAIANFETQPGSRREYIRVRVAMDDDGQLTAARYANQSSGVMSSVCWANALAEVDAGQRVRYGDRLKVYLLPD